MAWGNFILDKGYLVTAPIVKYRAVKFAAAAETVTTVTSATADDIVGFAQFGVSASEILQGKDGSIRMLGVTEAEAVGAIALGKFVTLEADGRVSQLAGASGKTVVGKCVGSPSTNAGDRIAMLIIHTPTKA